MCVWAGGGDIQCTAVQHQGGSVGVRISHSYSSGAQMKFLLRLDYKRPSGPKLTNSWCSESGKQTRNSDNLKVDNKVNGTNSLWEMMP